MTLAYPLPSLGYWYNVLPFLVLFCAHITLYWGGFHPL